MNKDEIFNEVAQIFADLFNKPINEIKYETSPDKLPEWDSLGHVQLIAALEEKFSLIFSPDMQAEMLNVELIIDSIQELVNS
jgi:acyl carrier protein